MFGILQRHKSLFLGVFALLAGFGLAGSLVSVELAHRGLSSWVGAVGVAYFLGLGLGSLRAERTIASIGYLRAYGLLTAVACLAVLLMVVSEHPAAWLLARMLQGFAVGGLFVCIESWLGTSTLPENRGQVLGLYQVIVYLGLACGQVLMGALAQAPQQALVGAAMLVCAAALPVGASRMEAPHFTSHPRLPLKALWALASLGVIGAFVSGVTTGAIYTVAPAAGVAAGLSNPEVAWWMTSFIGGGLVLQLPLGRASDRMDRRYVLAGIGGMAALGGLLSMAAVGETWLLILVAAFEGGWVFAIYAISLAYVFDRVSSEQAVSANAVLLATFCVGSGFGAAGSSLALNAFGAGGFFLVLVLPAAVMALASLRAAALWEPIPVRERGEVVLVPRTSPVLAELDPRIETEELPRDEAS